MPGLIAGHAAKMGRANAALLESGRHAGREKQVKLMKMFGLAALAAVAAMSFVGVTSASAESTVLCTSATELPCTNNAYTGHVEAHSSKAELLASFVNITCHLSTVLGTAGKLANPLNISITSLTFTNCLNGTVTVTDQKGSILVLKTAPNLATGTAHGFKVLVETNSGIHCVYGGVAKGAHGLGSTSPTSLGSIVASGVELEELEGGFFCPDIARWDATYSVTLPDPLYISS